MNLSFLKSALLAAMGLTATAFATESVPPHPDAADLANPPTTTAGGNGVTPSVDNLVALPHEAHIPDLTGEGESEVAASEPEESSLASAVPTMPTPQGESALAPTPIEEIAVISAPIERAPILELTPTEKAFASTEAHLLQQIRLLDLHLEVRDRQSKLSGQLPGTSQSQAAMPVPVMAEPAVQDVVVNPMPASRRPLHPFRLVSIWGAEGDLRAEFLTATAKRVVAPGGHIQDGWVLDTVRQGDVVVSNGKRRSTLALGN